MWLQFPFNFLKADLHIIIFNMNTCFCQYGIVEWTECIEVLCVHLDGTIAAHQMILKKDADLGYKRIAFCITCTGYFKTGKKIFFSVRAEYSDRELWAGEDDRFAQPFQHKTKGRCGICHRIRAVQNYKACVSIVMVTNDMHQFAPGFRVHVRRVHRRIELVSIDMECEILQLRYVLFQLLEIEIL